MIHLPNRYLTEAASHPAYFSCVYLDLLSSSPMINFWLPAVAWTVVFSSRWTDPAVSVSLEVLYNIKQIFLTIYTPALETITSQRTKYLCIGF